MLARLLMSLLSASLVGVLASLPAVAADDPPVTRRDLTLSSNNLKQIVLSFHSHHDVYDKLPGDILDKEGKPLLSWRVAILPFIDEAELYKSFKLDEPWDGPNNKKLIEKMPRTYAPIRVKAKAGETFYQTFTGPGTLYVKNAPAYKLANIPDGASNTGLVFEAGEPVVWSKPADIPFDEKKPAPKLGGMFDGEANVALCDGSVKLIKKDADPQQLKYLIMPADGNVIDTTKIFK